MKINRLLIVIFVLGLVLRFVSLASVPAGFTPDEASFGYDAYSILRTGRDQWGNFLPIVFKSFGDGKLPVYTYLAVPSVAIFGLTEFAVRFPNALLGSLAVLVIYFLVLEVYKDKRLANLSAFLLAISPWHIEMSRGAFEANLVTFFLPFALLFFFKGLKNKKYLVYSAIFFGINMFTYHTARYITPPFLVFLIYWYRNDLKLSSKYVKIFASIVIFSFLMTAFAVLSGGASRFSTSTILGEQNNVFNQRFTEIKNGEPEVIAKVFNNKATYLFGRFISNYFEYFSPQFLFTGGAGEGTYGMVPGLGVLYLYEVLFIAVFLWMQIKNRLKESSWLLAWLLLSPIAAAISVGPGYAANRAAIMISALVIISSIGSLFVYDKLKNKYLFLGIMLVFLMTFAERYYFGQPVREAKSMIYGTREVMNYVKNISAQYDQIIISKSISESQIFVAFYNKVEPSIYQDGTKLWNFSNSYNWLDQMPVYSLGKYVFTTMDWQKYSKLPSTLLVGKRSEFPEKTPVLKEVFYPDGTSAYVIVDTRTQGFAYKL